MKAVRLHQFGPAEVLQYEEVPEPVVRPHSVLIEVKAAGVNRGDLGRRRGTYPGEATLPLILGWEVAGVVREVGEAVTTVRPGERVLAMLGQGGYAERVSAYDAQTVRIPDNLSFEEAAAVPVVFLTSWIALQEIARVQEGEWVLVQAGASGVGMAAIQIARHAGARVIATAGSAAKLDFCRQLGATAGINYREEDLVQACQRLTDGQGVDVVLESVGGQTFSQSVAVLRRYGRLVTVGNSAQQPATLDPGLLIRGDLSLHGLWLGGRLRERRGWSAIHDILPLLASGALKAVVDRTFPLREAAAAHRYLEARRNLGKVVLVP
ncbi:MAG: NADP-dependent oxidoreductase [Candidatus Tectimicrobiota bacterium]|nr:MAG: NADP-dependent oxidoreductase [Candidatus Tectomicrobia bacterium]